MGAKYTIVKIIKCEVSGKNDTKYSFYLHDKIVNSYSHFIGETDRKRVINEKKLLMYDSTDITNNKFLLNVIIPNNIKVPAKDWVSVPAWAN